MSDEGLYNTNKGRNSLESTCRLWALSRHLPAPAVRFREGDYLNSREKVLLRQFLLPYTYNPGRKLRNLALICRVS